MIGKGFARGFCMYVLLFGRRSGVFVSGYSVVFLSFLLLFPVLVCFSCSLACPSFFELVRSSLSLSRLFVAWSVLVVCVCF